MSCVITSGVNAMQKLVLSVNNGQSIAEVYMHGATISRYYHHHTEYIYVSDKAVFNGVKAIRGGVPLVFPQFSQPNPAMPQHGLLRTASEWVLKSTDITSPNDIAITLELTSTPAMLAVWPHPFVADLKVHLTDSELKYTLSVMNSGTTPFECHTLLHTYFNIPSLFSIQVEGFHGKTYIDKLQTSGDLFSIERTEEFTFSSEVDRIYLGSTDIPDIIISVDRKPYVSTSKRAWKMVSGSSNHPIECDVVLWNPWIEKSTGMTDLGVENYPKFVCIEPGTVTSWVNVEAGAKLCLEQIVKPMKVPTTVL